ncbi:MAG: AtpZ/AtpI family protein [Chitinophagales bacterium]|nr:AtpZ/AtpI family protein [Chitinophagales bacterium]MCZ2394166.1 AtpZ/AtpI family protein [Chitinophagales bacterium]
MDNQNKKSHFQTWVRYSTIGSEMAGAVFFGGFGGHKIDQWMQNETPWATIGLLFVGLSAAFYIVYKQLK